MKVIVTGGRDYSDANMVDDVLDLFKPTMIVQGGAFGADRLARMYAEFYKIECVTMSADWEKHGKAAGPIRNVEMLKAHPDAVVVAFPGGRGTANCVQYACEMNMIVLRVEG